MHSGDTITYEMMTHVLTRILHRHAEEAITDEQVRRVIEPVLVRIEAGEFLEAKKP